MTLSIYPHHPLVFYSSLYCSVDQKMIWYVTSIEPYSGCTRDDSLQCGYMGYARVDNQRASYANIQDEIAAVCFRDN